MGQRPVVSGVTSSQRTASRQYPKFYGDLILEARAGAEVVQKVHGPHLVPTVLVRSQFEKLFSWLK